MADERRKLRCPRCGRVAWIDLVDDVVGARCPSCGGHHLERSQTETVLQEELGFSIEELRARVSGPAEGLGVCPSCEGPFSRVVVERSAADLCLRCGAAWFDPGELEALTGGRHLERRPPDDVARKYLPAGLAPDARRAIVMLPWGPRWWLRALLASAAAAGMVSVVVADPGLIPAMFYAAWLVPLLFVSPGYVVVSLANRTVRARGLSAQGGRAYRPVPFDDVERVLVFIRRSGKTSYRWAVHIRRRSDGTEPPLFSTMNRVLAHRVAFQLSQLIEVPVEVPEPPADDEKPTARARGTVSELA